MVETSIGKQKKKKKNGCTGFDMKLKEIKVGNKTADWHNA